MLSSKHASLAVRVLLLALAAAVSFFVVTAALPESKFVSESLASVEESSDTVMKFSAATLSTSLAISALPDDFGTPLADTLADMNIYFIAILVVLFFEKILIQFGIKAAFAILIPLGCLAGIAFVLTKRQLLKGLAVRLCVLGLAVALVVPCSTHLTDIVAADLTDYVNETISETEDGADKLGEAMTGGEDGRTVFEKLSELFKSAINDISDLLLHFRNNIRRCMNSIAILILTNCLMPLVTFFILKWIIKELFQIALPLPPLRRRRAAPEEGQTEAPELISAGEDRQ